MATYERHLVWDQYKQPDYFLFLVDKIIQNGGARLWIETSRTWKHLPSTLNLLILTATFAVSYEYYDSEHVCLAKRI